MQQQKPQKSRWNSQWLTLTAGFVIPILIFAILYLKDYRSYSMFLDSYDVKTNVFIKLATLSLIPNLVGFFFFNSKNWLYAARGLILATFAFGLAILIAYYSL